MLKRPSLVLSFNDWMWDEAEYLCFERDSPNVARVNGAGGLTKEICDLGPFLQQTTAGRGFVGPVWVLALV